MTEIVNAVGISREALYKALRADAQPRFETIAKICKALGVKQLEICLCRYRDGFILYA